MEKLDYYDREATKYKFDPALLPVVVKAIDRNIQGDIIWGRLTDLLRLKTTHHPTVRAFDTADDKVKAIKDGSSDAHLDSQYGLTPGAARRNRIECLRLLILDPETRPVIPNTHLPELNPTKTEEKILLIYKQSRMLLENLYNPDSSSDGSNIKSLVSDNPHFMFLLKSISQGYSFSNLNQQFELRCFSEEYLKKLNVNMINLILNAQKTETFHQFSRAMVFSKINQAGINWFDHPIYPILEQAIRTIISTPSSNTDNPKLWSNLKCFTQLLPVIHYAKETGQGLKNTQYPQSIDMTQYCRSSNGHHPISVPIEFICQANNEDDLFATTKEALLPARLPFNPGSLKAYLSAGKRMIENIALINVMNWRKEFSKKQMVVEIQKSRFNQMSELVTDIKCIQEENIKISN